MKCPIHKGQSPLSFNLLDSLLSVRQILYEIPQIFQFYQLQTQNWNQKLLLSTTYRQPVASVGTSCCSSTSGRLYPSHANQGASPASGGHIGCTCYQAILNICLPKKLKNSATEDHGFLCSPSSPSPRPNPTPPL